MRSAPLLLLLVADFGWLGSAAVADTDRQLTSRVKSALVSHGLVDRPDCIDFDVSRNVDPGVDQVEVIERHDPKCGGDPQIQHRLFEVLVDQKTHRMATDAADPVNGTMSVLK